MKKITFMAALILISLHVISNNIEVTNGTVTQQNVGSHYNKVKFNLTWENSWRDTVGPANCDAAWVFVKYKTYGGTWMHATLSTTPSDHSVTTPNVPMSFYPTPDGKGVFIYRSGVGNGNINLQDVLLQWNYGTDGVNDTAYVQIRVFAVEMVFIPEGPYYLGDGNLGVNPSTNGFSINNTGNKLPYKVTSENALTFCNSTYGSSDQVYNPSAPYGITYFSPGGYTSPACFPKGYQSFFIMKYEVTQRQYADFFNTLANNTLVRQNRYLNAPSGRHQLSWTGQANDDMVLAGGTTGERACGYFSWADACAYADWACLRPMSELEYEKAARGFDNTIPASPQAIFPVNLEYAWGTTNIFNAAVPSVGDGTATEGYGSCIPRNCNYSGGAGGPVRNGIFAAQGCSSNQREYAGASYYGVMELSGNLTEIVANIFSCYWQTAPDYSYNNNGGRPSQAVSYCYDIRDVGPSQFSSSVHGDGYVNGAGNSDVSNWVNNRYRATCDNYHRAWPYGSTEVVNSGSYDGMFYTGNTYPGYKGGSYNDAAAFCRASDRGKMSVDLGNTSAGNQTMTTAQPRQAYYGFRAVRSITVSLP